MELEKLIFSDEKIEKFCDVTKDFNNLHSPKYMKKKNKKTIVPGMYSIAFTISQFKKYLYFFNSVKINLGSMIFSDDFIKPNVKLYDNEKLPICVYNSLGNDIFKKENNISYFFNKANLDENLSGDKKSILIKNDDLNVYSNLIKTKNTNLVKTLYSISYSSKILLDYLNNTNEKFNDVSLIFEKKDVLPVYNSFDINLENGFFLKINNNLDYIVNFEKVSKRNVNARVDCYSENNKIFSAKYDIFAVPEKIILRMVKNLEN
ncbi:MAG: hypothetical protein ACLFPJ_03980 [Candidatus Woesearchaeota archaeon]